MTDQTTAYNTWCLIFTYKVQRHLRFQFLVLIDTLQIHVLNHSSTGMTLQITQNCPRFLAINLDAKNMRVKSLMLKIAEHLVMRQGQ